MHMTKDTNHPRKNRDNVNQEKNESMSALIITISGLFFVGFFIFSIMQSFFLENDPSANVALILFGIGGFIIWLIIIFVYIVTGRK